MLEYIEDNSVALAERDNYVGSWVPYAGSSIVLDVTKHYHRLDDAIRFGMANNQDAIFDILEMVAIDLPARQTSGTMTQNKAYTESVVSRMCKNR